MLHEWSRWRAELLLQEKLKILRHFRSSSDDSIQLHVFSDASDRGYGSCAYLRVGSPSGQVNCCLIIGKSRVAPTKKQTIPRLELTAAVLVCGLGKMIKQELEVQIKKEYYWVDSMNVLGYINNTSRHFKTFVANRLSVIQETTTPYQWRYVPTALNPADLASRRIRPCDTQALKTWTEGPKFLQQPLNKWPCSKGDHIIQDDDTEIKVESHVNIKLADSTESLVEYHSEYGQLLQTVAWYRCFFKYLQMKRMDQVSSITKGSLTNDEVMCAKLSVVRFVKGKHLLGDIKRLQDGQCVKKLSPLHRLPPFLDNGILRIGGRVRNADLEFNARYPMVIPKCHLSKLLINHVHMGKLHVLNKLRKEYWLIKGPCQIKRQIGDCFRCKRFSSRPCSQQMADLPKERATPNMPPFSFTGVDFFRLMYVKIR